MLLLNLLKSKKTKSKKGGEKLNDIGQYVFRQGRLLMKLKVINNTRSLCRCRLIIHP